MGVGGCGWVWVGVGVGGCGCGHGTKRVHVCVHGTACAHAFEAFFMPMCLIPNIHVNSITGH